MSFTFNAASGLIIVAVRIYGPAGHRLAELALDTGATASLIQTATLVAIGYDPATAPNRVLVTTGSGVEYVPRLSLDRVELWASPGRASRSWRTRCHPRLR